MGRIATFDLLRFDRARARFLASIPLARRRFSVTDGLVVGRLLGTAAGASTAGGVDLGRWAVFAVWEDEEAAEDFWTHDALARRWRNASQRWSALLVPRRSHGRWGGVEPFAADDLADGEDGPVAVLTRANVRALRLREFHAARGPVDATLDRTPGLLARVGMGEWPVGQQATMSLWRDEASVRDFARGDATHVEVVRRTRSERWYSEELFSAFSVRRHRGGWDGGDPLAPVIRPATGADLAALAEVESTAATRFAGWGLSGIEGLVDPGRLLAASRDGTLWVADLGGTPVGFALAGELDGAAFVEEIDVVPAFGRVGTGGRLMAEVLAWGRQRGYESVVLTTFRDVPWNEAWYRRLGFRPDSGAPGPGLAGVLERERTAGLDPARRLVMRLALRAPTTTGSG